MFHYTVQTNKSMEQVIHDLEQSLKNRKFGILWSLDIPATLQAKGVDYTKPYRILEVCNPMKAKEVLNEAEEVGYFLPCKIAVYEDSGVTKIGLPKPTVLMELVDRPSLQPIAAEVEKALVDAVNDAL